MLRQASAETLYRKDKLSIGSSHVSLISLEKWQDTHVRL